MTETERAAQIHRAIDLMIHTTRLHHRNIEKLFDNTGLHRSQRPLLMHLSRTNGATSQREIADRFDVSPACVARSLKSLAIDGYITRTGSEDDMRRNNVSITDKGRRTVEQTQHAFDALDASAFENMSTDEIDQLISLLSRVQNNLRRLEDSENNPNNP